MINYFKNWLAALILLFCNSVNALKKEDSILSEIFDECSFSMQPLHVIHHMIDSQKWSQGYISKRREEIREANNNFSGKCYIDKDLYDFTGGYLHGDQN